MPVFKSYIAKVKKVGENKFESVDSFTINKGVIQFCDLDKITECGGLVIPMSELLQQLNCVVEYSARHKITRKYERKMFESTLSIIHKLGRWSKNDLVIIDEGHSY